jgi:hypothetical protein
VDRQDMIRQAFERQAVACETLGSPFTARLCRLAAERLEAKGRVEQEILSWPNDSTGAGDAFAFGWPVPFMPWFFLDKTTRWRPSTLHTRFSMTSCGVRSMLP